MCWHFGQTIAWGCKLNPAELVWLISAFMGDFETPLLGLARPHDTGNMTCVGVMVAALDASFVAVAHSFRASGIRGLRSGQTFVVPTSSGFPTAVLEEARELTNLLQCLQSPNHGGLENRGAA